MKHTKSRILAIFLCLCMVVTLVPTVAFAAESGDVFKVDGSTYKDLSTAAEAASSSQAVSVIGDYSIQSTDNNSLKSITKIIIEDGGKLTVPYSNATALVGATASVEIKAGGALSLPDSLYADEEWFGGEDARMNIEQGSITLSGLDKITDGKCQWTLSDKAVVTVPEGKTAYLQLVGDISLKKYGVELSIPEGAALTVNGMLRGISGESSKYSKLTVNGSLDCTNGVLSLAAKPEVSVGATGSLSIGEKGIVTSTTGDTQYTTANKIKVAPGGTITLSENSKWKDKANSCISGTDTNTKQSYTDAEGSIVYGAAESSVSEPEAAIGGAFYTSLDGTDGALDKAKNGDTITLLKEAEISDGSNGNTIGEGVTLVVPKDKTLTVKKEAAAIMDSKGKLVVQAGGKVNLPTSASGDSSENWIGGTGDRLNLTEGSITYDFTENMLTLNGKATIPDSKISYLHLNGKAINGTIAKESELTVNGTLKVVSGTGEAGAKLTVDGTLKVADSNGKLTIADKASVEVSGTLELPLLSKEDITGTGSGTGLLGDVVINGGASVKYGTYQVIGGTSPLIALDTGAKATLNLAEESLTLNSGKATVNGDSSSGNMFSMLILKDSDGHVRLGITIDADATVEVPNGKTLKIVKDSSMTINGTLDVKGTLTIAEGVKSFAVNDGGTLKLPLMSKEAMEGDVGAGTGLRGDISIASGATVSYANAPILGGEGAYLTLSQDGTAVVNVKDGSIKLTAGTATVNGDESGNLKALLVASKSGDTEIVPLKIETSAGTTVTIPAGKTVSIPNNGQLTIGGDLNVSGALEIHSAASLSGKVNVNGNGTVAFYGDSTDATFYLAASGAKVLANSDIANQITSAAEIRTPSSLSYTSIADGETTFTNGWEYYKSASTGGSTGGGGGSGTTATVNSVKATNGSFAISDKNAKAGDTVKITPKANDGYVVDQVTVTDKNGNNITVTQNADGTYSFVMPAKSAQPVDVKVTFKLDDGEKDCPSEKFTDVDQDKWYHEGVDYAIKNGLMEGVGSNLFAPDATTTRAMVVTILYRLDGEPAVTKDIPFADVPAGQWYSNAINWAAANGIVDGYGNGKFGPDDTITREQMAAILYRYASYKGYSVSDLANLTGYTDAASVSEWASTAMRWAVAEGLIEGTSATTLSPSGDSTRAQVATILMRFCEGVVK